MVLAMGGETSPHFLRFKTLACEAFNILRKAAPLVLNMLYLMIHAGIPDISGHPNEKNVDPLKSVTKAGGAIWSWAFVSA